MEFIFNLLLLLVVGLPLLVLELASGQWKWLREHKGPISFLLWFAALFLCYNVFAPMVGMEPIVFHCGEPGVRSIFCR